VVLRAESYRPFGTPPNTSSSRQASRAPPDGVPFEQGACLGIPGITTHRCVHVAGPVAGRLVLIQGGAGSVGLCAVQLARRAGAHVLATVRSNEDGAVASGAGAHEVIQTGGVWHRGSELNFG
jgi:NADPH2:quinone reductase